MRGAGAGVCSGCGILVLFCDVRGDWQEVSAYWKPQTCFVLLQICSLVIYFADMSLQFLNH